MSIFESFIQNREALRDYISRFLISKHEIDDVSQEAFLRAFKAEKKKRINEPKAYLFRVAKNLILTDFRNKSRRVTDHIEDFEFHDPLDEGLNLEDNIIAQQKLGIYCEAVASLPPQCRRVILMKKVYGMSNKEIARRIGATVSAVDKHLVKGGRRCLAIMAERYPEVAEKAREKG